VAGVVALLALTSCAVDVPSTKVSGSQHKACAELVDSLPDHVSDQERRETKGNPLAAAWGDPPIVLRCGVGRPAGYDKFSACQVVNGLGWFVPEKTIDDQGADVVMTTVGRDPAVEVKVPATYRPPDAVMVDLGTAVKAHTRLVKSCS
jgi:Protein of unknown function (DUF3515)